MTQLVLIRHGQSQWNKQNRFTGWVDVDLTDVGEGQARKAGQLLADIGFQADHAFASYQTRAIRTLWLTLQELGQVYTPQTLDWRLNERHYGALTGLNKDEVKAEYGEDQLKIWRRSFDIAPNKLDKNSDINPCNDRRYGSLSDAQKPLTESLKDTLARVVDCWDQRIAHHIKRDENILIAAHGNSLRALVKHLLSISDADISSLEIPTGNPMVINFDAQYRPQDIGYLDQDRAQPLPELV